MRKSIHSLSQRILSRLLDAEAQEKHAWFVDDLRIARLTVAHAARGDAVFCSPHVLASYTVLGLHPEKVWPAIRARRNALGPVGEEMPPKKPAQSVKLWREKINGARAANSHAGMQQGSPRTTISVPMAAPSIAALYPNSGASSSAKTRGFSYAEMLAIVEFSGAPHSIRQGTLSALKARGRWPNEDGPATGVVCVSLIGMMLHGVCCRSTARWRAVEVPQVWNRTQGRNVRFLRLSRARKNSRGESELRRVLPSLHVRNRHREIPLGSAAGGDPTLRRAHLRRIQSAPAQSCSASTSRSDADPQAQLSSSATTPPSTRSTATSPQSGGASLERTQHIYATHHAG